MLHLQRRTLDAVGAARLRSGVGHVETVGVMDGYGSYPYYSSTKIRKLHLCYAKNVHQPWPLALKVVLSAFPTGYAADYPRLGAVGRGLHTLPGPRHCMRPRP